MTAVIRLLKTARDHIAGSGMFSPGKFYKDQRVGRDDVLDGPCCPLGAIGWAASCHPNSCRCSSPQYIAGLELEKTLTDLLNLFNITDTQFPVVSYSDTPGRTQAEIVDNLFGAAIAQLEAAA